MSTAATALAAGRLDTRLESSDDPDLRPIAASFNDMAQALQDRIESDARFASDVSHELRSPLMTLAASIEVMNNQRDDLPERARSALDLMVADIDRFRQLVEDLLEISRFDAGVVRLELEEVHLAELVMQAVSHSTDADVPVEVDAELAGVVVQADKRRIVRVIANLLDNAAKYGGGATSVSFRQVDDGVQIAVEDRGEGVPEEDRELIFGRFNRGSLAGRRGSSDGVGLGLALVAEHVNLHGGQVWVEDRADGRGALASWWSCRWRPPSDRRRVAPRRRASRWRSACAASPRTAAPAIAPENVPPDLLDPNPGSSTTLPESAGTTHGLRVLPRDRRRGGGSRRRPGGPEDAATAGERLAALFRPPPRWRPRRPHGASRPTPSC